MKVYIVYRLGDYAIPQAISFSRVEAEKLIKIYKKHDRYLHDYWVEEKTLTQNNIVEI